jgi:hypothetical protein
MKRSTETLSDASKEVGRKVNRENKVYVHRITGFLDFFYRLVF